MEKRLNYLEAVEVKEGRKSTINWSLFSVAQRSVRVIIGRMLLKNTLALQSIRTSREPVEERNSKGNLKRNSERKIQREPAEYVRIFLTRNFPAELHRNTA